MKQYKNKFLISTGPAEGVQLPNLYTEVGVKVEGDVEYVGLVQDGQESTEPTWFSKANIESDFEEIV